MLPNQVTQLAEPACHFLQQLDCSHSAQILCNEMTMETETTERPNFSGLHDFDSPFLRVLNMLTCSLMHRSQIILGNVTEVNFGDPSPVPHETY